LAAAVPESVSAQREWLLSFVPQAEPLTFLDLGCGAGPDLIELAARRPDPGSRFVGVDCSPHALAAARAAAGADRRTEFVLADLDQGLPFADRAFDCACSHNLLECLRGPAALIGELARVVRPGGTVVLAHWDWDTQLFDGSDRALVRRLVQGFADRRQAWMAAVDPWLGRRLWGLCSTGGAFYGEVVSRTLIETRFAPGTYGQERAHDFRELVEDGVVTAEECERFLAEQRKLDSEGRYFYALTGFAYVGRRAS
jgi:SAM-dependent methyltransferase